MIIKDLKATIADLPDDMPVITNLTNNEEEEDGLYCEAEPKFLNVRLYNNPKPDWAFKIYKSYDEKKPEKMAIKAFRLD